MSYHPQSRHNPPVDEWIAPLPDYNATRSQPGETIQDPNAFYISSSSDRHVTHDFQMLNNYTPFPTPKNVGIKHPDGEITIIPAYGYGSVIFNTQPPSVPLLGVWYLPEWHWNMVALHGRTMDNLVMETRPVFGIVHDCGPRRGEMMLRLEDVAGLVRVKNDGFIVRQWPGIVKLVHHRPG